jgi:CDP-diacylglycerol--glycerol-3-phosphate 3-phosphatidyltransferase
MPKTIYQLKPAFQNLLRPATRALWKAGISANQVTIGAVVLSIVTGAVVAGNSQRPEVLLLLAPVLFVRMALNAIDGMLAREFGLKSRLGAILNELGDVISDAALYLPLALGWGFPPALLTVVVVLAVISEMAGVLGVTIGSARRYDGPMGKSDRAFILGAAGLAIGCGVPSGNWQTVLLALMLLLLTITIWNRARGALLEGK